MFTFSLFWIIFKSCIAMFHTITSSAISSELMIGSFITSYIFVEVTDISVCKLLCLVCDSTSFVHILVTKHSSALSPCGWIPFLSPIKLCFSNFHVHTKHLGILFKSRYKIGLGLSLRFCSSHMPPRWGQHHGYHSLNSEARKQLVALVTFLQENMEVWLFLL